MSFDDFVPEYLRAAVRIVDERTGATREAPFYGRMPELSPDERIVWTIKDRVANTGAPDSKPTNPKDVVAGDKLPMHLVPSTAIAFESLALLEGALKYGKYNWRSAGVLMSVYLDALKRHLTKFENGEWADAKTLVPHLASIRACCAIILDADVCGKLTDDRPPIAPAAELVDALAANVGHLKRLYKDRRPHQYTIADSTAQALDSVSDDAIYRATVTYRRWTYNDGEPAELCSCPPAQGADHLPGCPQLDRKGGCTDSDCTICRGTRG